MPSIKLTVDETKARFGVAKAIDNFPSTLTKEEERNVKTVLKYMEVCSRFRSALLIALHHMTLFNCPHLTVY